MFKTKVVSKEGIENGIYERIISNLSNIRNDMFTKHYNVSSEDLSTLQKQLSVERVLLAVDATDSSLKNMVNLFASALTYLISVIIFTRIANEVSQEKSSKSSEYVLTTVSGKGYLFAKVASNILLFI